MGATINPLKLRVGRTQIWPTLFFTHTEKNYPAIVHPFINFQQALLEILRGITIYKHSSYHTNKRQVLFLFNDAKFLNTGNSLFIFVYLTSDLLLYKSRWFKKFLRIRRVPWYPKYAGLKKRVTPYHLLGRRLQARRRRQKTKKKNTLRKHYFRWFTRKRRRFKFGIRKWWRLQQLRPLFKSARLQSKVYVARAPKIPLELEKEEKVELLDFTEDDNHDFKVDLARLSYQKILKKSLFFKNKKFMTKYRVFYLIFYFYPLLAKLKTLINQWALQTFKQFASSEVFFLRSNVFRVNAYSIVKYAHMLFTEILLDKTAKKKIEYKKVFFRTLKYLEKLFYSKRINGYKLALTGRFSRRDRLTFIWRYGGDETPFSTIRMPIDYSIDYVWLKHGVCVLEVWICKTGNKPKRNDRD